MVISGEGKWFTELEKAYISKFYEHDGKESVTYALERKSVVSVANAIYRMRRDGLVDHYTKKWDKFMEA